MALLTGDQETAVDVLNAQLSASEAIGGWWCPSATVSRAARRRGYGPVDPVRLAQAYARQLERTGDDRALLALRALQVGADPEWRPVVSAAADRLAAQGRTEPMWWPPDQERVGRCMVIPWAVPDGRFELLVLEVLQGPVAPIALTVVVDDAGTIVEILITTELASLLEIPEEHDGRVPTDPRWGTPEELVRRLREAIDRTDLLGVAPPPRFLPGTGYPALRGLLRSWIDLAVRTTAAT